MQRSAIAWYGGSPPEVTRDLVIRGDRDEDLLDAYAYFLRVRP